MAEAHDPELIDALERIFMTRSEMRAVTEYQQKLFSSLQELTNSHRAVHEHVRKLTDAHNRIQDDTGDLQRTRGEVLQTLRNLDDSHRQTQGEMRRALDTLNFIQREIQKVPRLEERLRTLERDVQKIWQDDKSDDRKLQEQEQRLKKVEHRKHFPL